MLWPLLTGRIGIALGSALAAGALAAWGTATFLNASHDAEIKSIRADAALAVEAATQRAVEVERAHNQLATKLEVQHEKATRQLAAIRADNRRLSAELGGLRDPFAAPACPVSTAADGTVDPAAAAATGRLSDETEGLLSNEASEFLLELAAEADRAALYATTCHRWVMELHDARQN